MYNEVRKIPLVRACLSKFLDLLCECLSNCRGTEGHKLHVQEVMLMQNQLFLPSLCINNLMPKKRSLLAYTNTKHIITQIVHNYKKYHHVHNYHKCRHKED